MPLTAGRQKPLRGRPLGPPTSRSLRPGQVVSIQGARSPLLHLTDAHPFLPTCRKQTGLGNGAPGVYPVCGKESTSQAGPSLQRMSSVLAEKVSGVTTNREADPQVGAACTWHTGTVPSVMGSPPGPPLQ